MSGGSLTIINPDAKDTDGIDCDGTVTVSGGTIQIFLNGNGKNTAVDFNAKNGGSFVINGGKLLLCGGRLKAAAPGSVSGQCTVFLNIGGLKAGDEIKITDKNGSVLFASTPAASVNNIIFSHPDMKQGETVTLHAGGKESEIKLSDAVVSLSL